MGSGQIVVAPLSAEPHVFDLWQTPRLRVLDPGAPAAAAPDIFVYPSTRLTALSADDPLIDPAMWPLLREGRARLVLDSSGEGRPHDPRFSEAAHRTLDALGVAAGQVSYLTQHRFYAEDYAAWARGAGLKDLIRVRQYDYYVRNFLAGFETDSQARWWRKEKAFRRRLEERPRLFISLNRTLRLTKLIFLARLARDGLFDQGLVSVGSFSKSMPRHKVAERIRRAASFSDLAEEVEPHLDAIASHIDPDVRTDLSRKVRDSVWTEHDETFFTVVTETEMEPRPIRMTEKPLKALANYHPLLILGNVGALKMLKQMGFETFSAAIDERYDDESDPRARFEMVYAEFRRLCGLGQAALYRMERDLTDVLRHNARRTILELPALYRDTIDPRLLASLTPASAVRA